MFGGEITDALVSKVAKTIPRELCSQLSKPGIEQQGQGNPHTDPSPYNNITMPHHPPHFSPHFTDREMGCSRLRNLPLVPNPRLSDPKTELFQINCNC